MNEKKASLKTNTIYNIVYQVVCMIVPLFTAPYVSRVLGAEGVGNISYTQAICAYFNLIASLGTGTYAQRLIASKSRNRDEMSREFWNIIFLKLTLAIIGMSAYTGFSILWGNNYRLLLLVQLVDLSTNAVDIVWLYQGLENFKKTVTRQIVVKIAGALGVFLFVKSADDTYIYLLCYSVPNVLGLIALWPGVQKYIGPLKFEQLHPLKHLKGAFGIFVPYIAALLFSYVDKLMLGSMLSGNTQTGYYEQGLKFVSLAIGMVNALSIVLVPRIANLYSAGMINDVKKYVAKSLQTIFAIGSLISVGLFVVSSNLVPWYFGNQFYYSITVTKILSLLVILKGINSILGSGFLIATFQQGKYSIAISAAAIVNITLNAFFIPNYGANGAASASVMSEFCLTVLLITMAHKIISSKTILISVWKYLVAAAIDLAVFIPVSNVISSSILNTLILTLGMTAVYILILIIERDQFFLNTVKSEAHALMIKMKINKI